MASSSGAYNSPCAACKFLRRKCMPGCIFSPYFPPEEPHKFANVHKVFGASNVSKLLNELPPHHRDDAVSSLAYEAEARIRDPVYGCVGAISFLHRQVERLQKELDAAHADLIRCASAIGNRPPVDETATEGVALIYQTPSGGYTYTASNGDGTCNYQTPWSGGGGSYYCNPNGGDI